MANPRPDFFVKFSKELYDAVLRARMPASHLLVLLTIVRLTAGDRGRSQAAVSLGILAKATGRSRSCLREALADLMLEGVIVEIQPPTYGRPRDVALNNDYETWGRFSLKPTDIPNFLRHDWDSGQYRQAAQCRRTAQGGESEQGSDTAQNHTGQPHTPVPPGRTELCGQAAPTKEETNKTETERSSSGKSGRQVVVAPSETDWQERANQLLERSAFRSELERLAEILATENRSGRVSLSRVVGRLYEPLLALEAEVSEAAMRHGLQVATARDIANVSYIAKAARGYCGVLGPARGGGPRQLTESDNEFFTEHFDD
jgi:hypothetical protein